MIKIADPLRRGLSHLVDRTARRPLAWRSLELLRSLDAFPVRRGQCAAASKEAAMGHSELIEQQKRIYRDSYLEHGDSPRATFNNDHTVQDLRFERLLAPLISIRSEFSIHDVGAGLCDLHRYLLDRGIDHAYSATEIVPEMVELARKKYPEARIELRDLLRDEGTERHDFVVLSGVFNIPGDTDREVWRDFVLAMLRKMYEMAGCAIAFNFLTAYRTFTDPSLYYVDPLEIFDFCHRDLSRFITLDHAYPLYECSLAVFRPEAIRAVHGREGLGKYFANERFRP
jgi:hypothetical protein